MYIHLSFFVFALYVGFAFVEFDTVESAGRALEAYGVPTHVEGETKEELEKKDPGEMLTSIKSYVKERKEEEDEEKPNDPTQGTNCQNFFSLSNFFS